MSARHVAGAVVLTLVGLPLGADNAQARGGGSTGSASSGQHHQGGGGGSSSSSSSSSGSSSSGSSGSSYSRESSGGGGGGSSRSARSDAQRRHPRPGTGHGSYRPYNYYSPYYYRPYSYGYYGYYPSWYSGYYGYGYYDSPYYSGAYRSPYSGYYSGRYRSGDVGSLRLLVDPSEARVYVDGYFAGNVDDFDGLFQRLNLTRGRHDLAFKLEGYRTYRMRVYVPSDQTLKIHYDMVKGTGEDIREEALGSPEDDRNDDRWARRERDGDDEAEEDDDRGRAPVREPRRDPEADRDRAPMRDRDPQSEEPAPRPSGGRGMLMLEVEPADASVYVDGEFRGAARQARTLELPEGRHRVEVVRPGYKPVEREIEIRAGRSEKWQVSLSQP